MEFPGVLKKYFIFNFFKFLFAFTFTCLLLLNAQVSAYGVMSVKLYVGGTSHLFLKTIKNLNNRPENL